MTWVQLGDVGTFGIFQAHAPQKKKHRRPCFKESQKTNYFKLNKGEVRLYKDHLLNLTDRHTHMQNALSLVLQLVRVTQAQRSSYLAISLCACEGSLWSDTKVSLMYLSSRIFLLTPEYRHFRLLLFVCIMLWILFKH